MADLLRVRALGRAPRGQVRLERDLDHDRAAGAGHLGAAARRGRGRARARARGRPRSYAPSAAGRCRPSILLDGLDPGPRARRSSTAACVISRPAQAPPKPRAGELLRAARRRRSRRRGCSRGAGPAAAQSSITWSALPTAPSARQRAYSAACSGRAASRPRRRSGRDPRRPARRLRRPSGGGTGAPG